jgi:23S rRNA (uridine2552-2'-O)-methyltransferase
MKKPIPSPDTGKKHRHNKGWMQEHVNDPYVQRAKAEGWRSRAAFKLIELDDKYRLIRSGMTVADLGSAPGSWSQVVRKRLHGTGRIVALDLLPMDPIPGVDFIQGDFREDSVFAQLEDLLAGGQVDLVLSDMAPNISGIAVADQARVMHLAELTLDFCERHLRPEGAMLVKVFQGSGFTELRSAVAKAFAEVHVKKPSASRDRSAETYLLARGHHKLPL